MKNQYFGDVNDYRKYGLLRALTLTSGLSLAVGWMLTPNDASSDGGFRRYLSEPMRWRRFDPELFDHLKEALATSVPAVSLIERSGVLPGSRFFSNLVPDDRSARREWEQRLVECCEGADLVFLDPDNGLEVQSKPLGRKGSSKYVGWGEIEKLTQRGASVLVYQHYCRESRSRFTSRLASELRDRTGASFVEAFSTPHVVFLLAGQAGHAAAFQQALDGPLTAWAAQLEPVGLSQGLQAS